ncbi:hypothetical protein V8E54_011860, partial [Elaphomyces granulatus]
QLSDPAKTFKLPFPFVYNHLPCRLDVDTDRQFTYMGREMFKELQKMFKSIQQDLRWSAIWLYGTQGYGKSHILAAMVCYLVTKGQKVVYIPDCESCRKDPVEYIRAAMLFAWVEEDNEIYEILKLDTLEEMDVFFQASRDLVFVYDQLNALESHPNILQWLTRFRLRHKAILSSSANYTSYLETCHRQSSEKTLRVYGGLTVKELEQWWLRKNINMGDYTKDEVEDLTGGIPLLLESCIVDNKIDLNVGPIIQVAEQASKFVKNIKTNQAEQWQEYVCFSLIKT